MLLAWPNDGNGVRFERDGKRDRAKFVLDRRLLSLARAATWARYQELGFSIASISEIFNCSASTIYADLTALRDARSETKGDGLKAFLAALLGMGTAKAILAKD